MNKKRLQNDNLKFFFLMFTLLFYPGTVQEHNLLVVRPRKTHDLAAFVASVSCCSTQTHEHILYLQRT